MPTLLVFDERRTVRALIVQRLVGVDTPRDRCEHELRAECVAEPDEVLASFRRRPADLVLIGTRRASGPGIELTRRVLAVFPTAAVVVLGQADDARVVQAAIDAGARGFLCWDDLLTAPRADTQSEAVLSAVAGIAPRLGIVSSPELARGRSRPSAVSSADAPGRIRQLTDRELEVLAGMSYGMSNGEIARELSLSEDTVKTHARRLFQKLGVGDRAGAVGAGFRHDLLR